MWRNKREMVDYTLCAYTNEQIINEQGQPHSRVIPVPKNKSRNEIGVTDVVTTRVCSYYYENKSCRGNPRMRHGSWHDPYVYAPSVPTTRVTGVAFLSLVVYYSINTTTYTHITRCPYFLLPLSVSHPWMADGPVWSETVDNRVSSESRWDTQS